MSREVLRRSQVIPEASLRSIVRLTRLGPIQPSPICYQSDRRLSRRAKRSRGGVLCPLPGQAPTAPDKRGSMDWVHEILGDGRRIRLVTVADDNSRDSLAIGADTLLTVQPVRESSRRCGERRSCRRSGPAQRHRVHLSGIVEMVAAKASTLNFVTAAEPVKNTYWREGPSPSITSGIFHGICSSFITAVPSRRA